MRTYNPPKKPVATDWHHADIKAALEKKGWSLRRLALHHGYCGHYFASLHKRRLFRAQQLIADALGVTPQAIWPSRYTENGDPLTRSPWLLGRRPEIWCKPTRKRNAKDTTLGEARNVKNGPAA